MNNLSKIEKRIIEFLINSDIVNVEEDIEFLGGISQKTGCTIENLIYYLLREDNFLVYAGLIIDFDDVKNEYTIHATGIGNDDSIFIGDWNSFQKLNYLLVKTSNFLNQLERESYLDKVYLRQSFKNSGSTYLPYGINARDSAQKTLQIKNQEIVSQFLDCFAFYYVPNFKLREYFKNNFRTPESILAEKENEISKANLKIAKFGLYTAVISALASFIAIMVAVYSLGIPATVKINSDQVKEIKESIQTIEKHVEKDTIYIKK